MISIRALHVITFTMITLATIITTLIMGQSVTDCDDPQVWGTQTGVRHCAVNGGK